MAYCTMKKMKKLPTICGSTDNMLLNVVELFISTYLYPVVHMPNMNRRIYLFCNVNNWLVVLAILKNISQWEELSHILWKIKNVPNHQPEFRVVW